MVIRIAFGYSSLLGPVTETFLNRIAKWVDVLPKPNLWQTLRKPIGGSAPCYMPQILAAARRPTCPTDRDQIDAKSRSRPRTMPVRD